MRNKKIYPLNGDKILKVLCLLSFKKVTETPVKSGTHVFHDVAAHLFQVLIALDVFLHRFDGNWRTAG